MMMHKLIAISFIGVCAAFTIGPRSNGMANFQVLEEVNSEQFFDPPAGSPTNNRRTKGNGGVNLDIVQEVVEQEVLNADDMAVPTTKPRRNNRRNKDGNTGNVDGLVEEQVFGSLSDQSFQSGNNMGTGESVGIDLGVVEQIALDGASSQTSGGSIGNVGELIEDQVGTSLGEQSFQSGSDMQNSENSGINLGAVEELAFDGLSSQTTRSGGKRRKNRNRSDSPMVGEIIDNAGSQANNQDIVIDDVAVVDQQVIDETIVHALSSGNGGVVDPLEEVLPEHVILDSVVPTTTRRGGRRRNRDDIGGNVASIDHLIIEEPIIDEIDVPTTRGGKRRRNRKNKGVRVENFRADNQIIDPVEAVPSGGLRRRGNGIVSAQRVLGSDAAVQGGRGAQEGAVAQSSLKAGSRNLDAIQALLQQKQAKQERLDAKAEKKARRKDAARAAKEDSLKAEAGLDFETYKQAENFHNLDAAASEASANDFGLQLISNNAHKADAALSENSGDKFSSGTRLSHQEAVNAESFFNEEAVHEDEFVDNALLSAEWAAENLLNAQEAARQENEEFIDAQNFQQGSRGFRQNDFFGSSGGAFADNQVFGNNPFGF